LILVKRREETRNSDQPNQHFHHNAPSAAQIQACRKVRQVQDRAVRLAHPARSAKKKNEKKTRTDSLFYSNAGIMRKGLRSFAPKGKNAAQQNMQRVATASPTPSRGADG
jgi:hypothetical protein